MHIDSYEFGRIVIDGQVHTGDVLIYSGKIWVPWRRKAGHHLVLEDLKNLLASNPPRVIIGTGYAGMMSVDETVVKYLREHSIPLSTSNTQAAVAEYNRSPSAAAAFHLTC